MKEEEEGIFIQWRRGQKKEDERRRQKLEEFEKIDKAEVTSSDKNKNKIEDIGLQLSSITPSIRTRFNISKEINGVFIANVG